MDTEQSAEPVLISTEDVLDRVRVRVCLATIRNWIRHRQFPKPRYIGTRAYWVENEVEEWQRSQMKMKETRRGGSAGLRMLDDDN